MNSTGICLEQTLAALRQWVAEREGDDAKVIEGATEPTALPEREAEAANLIEGTAEPVALPDPAPTDEQIDAALHTLREMLAQRAGETAKVIEGPVESVARPAHRTA